MTGNTTATTTTDSRNRQPKGVSIGGQFAAEKRPEPTTRLTLRVPAPTGTGWSDRVRSEYTEARAEAARLEEAHWAARQAFDEAPSSSSDPKLKEYGSPTWDDAVDKVEGAFRSTVTAAADIAEKHYQDAGCKYASYYARDMTEAAVNYRQAVKPIVKRSGEFVEATKQAVETLLADPEWEPARAATETKAEELVQVLADRRGIKARHKANDERKAQLLSALNKRKGELKAAYDRAHTAEAQMRNARALDASGVPVTAVPVGLRQRDVLAINPDGTTNMWARPAATERPTGPGPDHHDGDHDGDHDDLAVRPEELFQKVVAAEPLEGPGGGLRLTLADGSTVSSVAREERQAYGRPRVRSGDALELYAEPPALGSRRASEVFGQRFARVGGYDDLY